MRAVAGSGGRPLDVTLSPRHPGRDGRAELQRAMTEGAGVLRDATSLERTAKVLAGVGTDDNRELANLVTVGQVLVAAALAREENRGNHWRADFPDTREELRVRLVTMGAGAARDSTGGRPDDQ
jgi:L-aspartate oxidase